MTPRDLKLWRKSRGLSQVRAAELLGCSRRALQMWEAENNRIPKSIALAVSAVSRKLKPYGEDRPVA